MEAMIIPKLFLYITIKEVINNVIYDNNKMCTIIFININLQKLADILKMCI